VPNTGVILDTHEYGPSRRAFTDNYVIIIFLYTVSQNVLPLTCYIDVHNPITIIFGRSVTKKVTNQTMPCFPTSPI